MKQGITFRHEFVESFPDTLKERTLYISMEFATTSHRCACGCGKEVVTPLSPTDWKLTFDGRTITLYPSIGNWGFECRSHYWIRNNQIEWAPSWSAEEIKAGRAYDKYMKEEHFRGGTGKPEATLKVVPERVETKTIARESGIWEKLARWWHGR